MNARHAILPWGLLLGACQPTPQPAPPPIAPVVAPLANESGTPASEVDAMEAELGADLTPPAAPAQSTEAPGAGGSAP